MQTLGEKEGCSDGCDYLLELISYVAGRMFAEAGNRERPSVSRAAITSEAARKVCSCGAPSATM